MTDDEFTAELRARVKAAPIQSSLAPSSVRVRARRLQLRRRLLGLSGSAALVITIAAFAAPLALEGLGLGGTTAPVGADGPTPTAVQPGAATSSPDQPSEEARRDTNGVQPCSASTPPSPEEAAAEMATQGDGSIGGIEGWWNSTPSDIEGNELPVDQWPQEILDHPATVQLDTRDGRVLESFDRRTCGEITNYVSPPLAELPANAIVVLDAESGEVLGQLPANS